MWHTISENFILRHILENFSGLWDKGWRTLGPQLQTGLCQFWSLCPASSPTCQRTLCNHLADIEEHLEMPSLRNEFCRNYVICHFSKFYFEINFWELFRSWDKSLRTLRHQLQTGLYQYDLFNLSAPLLVKPTFGFYTSSLFCQSSMCQVRPCPLSLFKNFQVG